MPDKMAPVRSFDASHHRSEKGLKYILVSLAILGAGALALFLWLTRGDVHEYYSLFYDSTPMKLLTASLPFCLLGRVLGLPGGFPTDGCKPTSQWPGWKGVKYAFILYVSTRCTQRRDMGL